MMKFCLLASVVLPIHLLAQSLVIRHINLVDVTNGAIKPDQTVTIQGNRITSIGTDNNQKSGATVVDGTNKYLIPGLWDMHTHAGVDDVAFKKEFVYPLMLANGITGIRIMWGSRADLGLRDSMNKGLLVAPRMVVGSPLLEGPGSILPWSLVIANAQQVPVVVDSLWKTGYDFMKVYSFLRSDLFVALASYCNRRKIPFAGHVPVGVTAEQASLAGMRSFEHFYGLAKSYAANEKQLVARWEQAADTAKGMAEHLAIFDACEFGDWLVDSAKAKRLTAILQKNRTEVVPTLAALRGVSFNQDTLNALPDMQYADKKHREMWKVRYVTLPPSAFQKAFLQLAFLHRQGITILAGSDCENPYTIHGFTLHEELEWYQQAGLSPLEVLQTATLNPAVFLNREKELGSVAVGKLADLVILNANPLIDIRNTRKIDAIILNGHLLNKQQLDSLLQQVKAKAAAQ